MFLFCLVYAPAAYISGVLGVLESSRPLLVVRGSGNVAMILVAGQLAEEKMGRGGEGSVRFGALISVEQDKSSRQEKKTAARARRASFSRRKLPKKETGRGQEAGGGPFFPPTPTPLPLKRDLPKLI